MRLCVVRAASTVGVAVQAQDDDARLINDLKSFRDPGHIQGTANLMAFITMPRDQEPGGLPRGMRPTLIGYVPALELFDPEATR